MSGSVRVLPRRIPRIPALVVLAGAAAVIAAALALAELGSGIAIAPRPNSLTGVSTFEPNVLLLLTEVGPGSRLVAADALTGRTLASIGLGTSAMAVFRAKTGEVLASDLVVDPADPATANARLLILDRSLRLVRTMPMPHRIQYTVYAPAMALSADEESLFYVARTDCGVACDDFTLNTIALDEARITQQTALPRNCGYPEIVPTARGVSVLCPQLQSIWRARAGEAASELAASASLPTDWPVEGGILENGYAYMVTQKGRLLVLDGNRALRDQRLLGPGQRFSGVQRWRAEGSVILGVKEGSDDLMTGLLVLELGTFSAREVALPGGSTFAAYIGGDQLAVLHQDDLSVVNLVGSAGTRSVHLLTPATWIIGVER